jgi:hypothetical protein
MTAGHNAFRGSGPDQKHAFKDGMAQVGCPDRRINRHCIKCCSSSQPLRHAGRYPARSRLRRGRDRFLVTFALGDRRPGHPGELVGERDGGDLGRSSRQQSRKPGPMAGAMDFGEADHGKRTSRKQAAQIAITLFADTAKLVLASA